MCAVSPPNVADEDDEHADEGEAEQGERGEDEIRQGSLSYVRRVR